MNNLDHQESHYTATLLFQYRSEKDGHSNHNRICEERIFQIVATTPDKAYQEAEKQGYLERFDCNEGGRHICYEYVGILELVELSYLNSEHEISHRFVERLTPMEQKAQLIPPRNKLSVFKKKLKMAMS